MVSASPVTFTYTLNVPATAAGSYSVVSLGIVRQAGVPIQLVARPDPLVLVSNLDRHSADTDHDFRISLLELTRVIELYNVRLGTVRTGRYLLQAGTEDGFAADPLSTVNQTLAGYHSVDANRNGQISLLELTRLIELYNFRAGTVRTGQYHVQAGTEDGFAPGP